MSDREKLIELIREVVVDYWAEIIADHLLKNGVVLRSGTPLENFDLSLRAYNALRRAGINTIEELRTMDEDRIANLRGIGVKILDEILNIRNGGISHEDSDKT